MILERGSGYCMGVNENLVGNQFLNTVRLSRLQTSDIRQGATIQGQVSTQQWRGCSAGPLVYFPCRWGPALICRIDASLVSVIPILATV
ncbi:Inner centromere protein [Fusarium oxysporum f. sp. albedinis]|nr:Inner centromere protein [Fusarium oxysporum f. sp. albedinis]